MKKNDYITLKEIWELFCGHIYLFIIFLTLSLLIAIAYIVFTPPTYTHQASVLIGSRSQQENRALTGSESFNDIGLSLFNTNSNAVSELHILKSPAIMEEVVRRLKLNYDYSVKYKSIRSVSLYVGSPIKIELDSILDNTNISFSVKLNSESQAFISNLEINGVEMELNEEVSLSTKIPIPQGTIKIEPSACYIDYIGKTILFSRNHVMQIGKKYSEALTGKMSEDKAPIIELSFSDTNQERANDVLSKLIEVYNENWISDKNQITISTSAFIDERLNVIEGELGNVDNNISSYKSSRMLPNVEAITNVYLSQASATKSQLVSLQNQLSVAQYISDFFQDRRSKGQLLPSNIGVESANINSQIDRYNIALLEKNKLVAGSSEQNPLVIDLNNSLDMMRTAINRSVNEYISTINIQIKNISKEEQKTNSRLQMNPSEAKYLLSEERKQKVKEGLYLFLLQQREQNELSQAFTAYNTKIVNYPSLSSLPASPRKSVVLIIAFMLGIIIPALVIWIRENADTLVRSKEDLQFLSIPLIGEIPLIKEKKRAFRDSLKKDIQEESPKLVVEDNSRNIINEAFRNIRTNIDYMKPKQENGIVIMDSSLFPNSGKTFIIANLALAMGIKGSKVAVVDVDMRKATLSKLVSFRSKGLANYLVKDIDHIENCIINGVIHPNVDIIPVGIIPPNPTELLLSDKFEIFITQLRQKYDYIFLDCPPIEIVADSSIINKHCDMTLFILRANALDKRLLPKIEEVYQKKTYNGLALVLNGVEHNNNAKYGYKKYGYGNYEDGYYSKE